MTNTANITVDRSRFNGFAQVLERTGLAIMGAIGALYVIALLDKADIDEINSLGVLFSIILYSSFGFYLGTDVTSLPFDAADQAKSGSNARRTNPYAILSAAGTLLAAAAAFVSVFMIVFDEVPPLTWNVGIASCWMLGVLLKLAVGTAVRLGQPTRATA